MVDWPILAQLRLEEEVRGMLQIGNCYRAFMYEELVHRETTLEIPWPFELDRALVDFSHTCSI